MSAQTAQYSDAAKRISDWYNLHRMNGGTDAIGKWFAVAMSDGSTDGVLYDSRRECVRHQKHNEMYYAYLQIRPFTMEPKDAETFLNTHRRMYDKGIRLADPDHSAGGREMIKRLAVEDQRSQLIATFLGLCPPSNIIYPRRLG